MNNYSFKLRIRTSHKLELQQHCIEIKITPSLLGVIRNWSIMCQVPRLHARLWMSCTLVRSIMAFAWCKQQHKNVTTLAMRDTYLTGRLEEVYSWNGGLQKDARSSSPTLPVVDHQTRHWACGDTISGRRTAPFWTEAGVCQAMTGWQWMPILLGRCLPADKLPETARRWSQWSAQRFHAAAETLQSNEHQCMYSRLHQLGDKESSAVKYNCTWR